LRWYLEDYLAAPFAVYEQRGQEIHDKLAAWGTVLFEGIFAAGSAAHIAYIKAREGETELAVSSRSPEFLGLPWELLRDPHRATPLALELRRRRLVSTRSTSASAPVR
jgi:hypothetical protein